MVSDAQRVRSVAEEIARYLTDHPGAADSVEGILNWWLARQRYADSKAEVEQALEELVKQNKVKRATLPDGTVIYSKC